MSRQPDGAEVRSFSGTSDQIGEARTFVRRALEAHGVTAGLNDAVLMTSELVTNAIAYGHGPVLVTARTDGHRTHVEVTNSRDGDGTPHLVEPADHDLGGRGLRVVDQLADAWGTAEHQGCTKVWFELAHTPAVGDP